MKAGARLNDAIFPFLDRLWDWRQWGGHFVTRETKRRQCRLSRCRMVLFGSNLKRTRVPIITQSDG